MILTVSSFAFCFVKKRLAHNQSRSLPKTSLNASLPGFSGIGNHMCTWLHGCNCNSYLDLWKMSFYRWALAITAVPTTLTSRFPTTGYARVL